MIDNKMLIIALGISWGMFMYKRTGYSSGGIITPGFITLELAFPERIFIVFFEAGVISLCLALMIRATGIYGRQKVGFAMLCALGIKFLFSGFSGISSSFFIGWVLPGLIGVDMQRQGFFSTVAASMSTALVTAMTAVLIFSLKG